MDGKSAIPRLRTNERTLLKPKSCSDHSDAPITKTGIGIKFFTSIYSFVLSAFDIEFSEKRITHALNIVQSLSLLFLLIYMKNIFIKETRNKKKITDFRLVCERNERRKKESFSFEHKEYHCTLQVYTVHNCEVSEILNTPDIHVVTEWELAFTLQTWQKYATWT